MSNPVTVIINGGQSYSYFVTPLCNSLLFIVSGNIDVTFEKRGTGGSNMDTGADMDMDTYMYIDKDTYMDMDMDMEKGMDMGVAMDVDMDMDTRHGHRTSAWT
jgi:hypothetical protein